MKIAITGHRPNKLGNDYDLVSPMIQKIQNAILSALISNCEMDLTGDGELVKFPNLTLITGMALGIDTLFAKIAIANNIPFIAAIPCKKQWARWPKKSQMTWFEIVQHPLCTKHYVSRELYSSKCMDKRNEWMVDNCDLLIAVWDETPGGTYNCIKYAIEKDKRIIFINPKHYI